MPLQLISINQGYLQVQAMRLFCLQRETIYHVYVFTEANDQNLFKSLRLGSRFASTSSSENHQYLAHGQFRRLLRVISLFVPVVQVGLQCIMFRDTRKFLNSGVDGRNRIRVLQVGADSLEPQGCPDKDLVHALRDITPLAQLMRDMLVFLTRLLDGLATFPEEYLKSRSLDSLCRGE